METTFLIQDTKYQVRRTKENDLEKVAGIMRGAFKMWQHIGVDKSKLTAKDIRSFSLPDGHVVLNSSEEIVAAFNIRDAEIKFTENQFTVSRAHKIDTSVLDTTTISKELFSKLKLLYQYGLCVSPKHSKSGLGKALFEVREEYAKSKGYDGILLETGKEAEWLVKWYKKIGFDIIGNSPLSTHPLVMMLKKF